MSPPVTFDDPPAPPARTGSSFIADPDTTKSQTVVPPDKSVKAPASGFTPDPTENAPDNVDPPPNESFFGKLWHFANHPIMGKKASQNVAGAVLPLLGGMPAEDIEEKKKQFNKEFGGHPLRDWVRQFRIGVAESEANLVQGLSTPASIGLAALSLGESLWGDALWTSGKAGQALLVVGKATQTGAAVTFGTQGLMAALTPRREGESDADYSERVFMGLGQAALASAGEYAKVKDATRMILRNKLHLSDTMADWVSTNLERISKARAEEAEAKSTIEQLKSQKTRAAQSKEAQARVKVQSDLEDNLRALDSQTNARMRNINESAEREIHSLREETGELNQRKVGHAVQVISDSARMLHEEDLRVKAPFEEIGDEFEGPVSGKTDIRNLVLNTLKQHNVEAGEMPAAALKPLGGVTEAETYIDTEGGIKAIEGTGEGEGVDFNKLGRVKDSLYRTGYGTRNRTLRGALIDAAEKVGDLQESAVLKHDETSGKYPRQPRENASDYAKRLMRSHPDSMTARYMKAKSEYMKFRRGIGSEFVSDWLDASDEEQQQLFGRGGKISKLLVDETLDKTSRRNLAIRQAIRAVGVDTSAFDATVDAIRAAEKRAGEIPKETKTRLAGARDPETARREAGVAKEQTAEAKATAKQEVKEASEEAKAATSEVERATKETVTKAEKEGTRIPGTDEEIVKGKELGELASYSNEQLLRMRMESMANQAMGNGVGHFNRYIMIVYGLWDIVRGRPWGVIPAAYGAREKIPSLLKNKDFQDWVIRQSGIEPANKRGIAGVRRFLSQDLYSALRREIARQTPTAAVGESQRRGEPAKQITLGEPPEAPER